MAETTPDTWRFVRAGDVSDGAIAFDGLDVRSTEDDSLGRVRGFIVDAAAARLHYVVVESGGWFTGGSYLVPPAYTRLDAENRVLWTELTKDAISRFPEFDEDRVGTLSREDLWAIERRIITAYGDDPGVVAPSADWGRESWSRYEQPAWWSERGAPAATDGPRADDVTGRDSARVRPLEEERDAGQRAQPGDVLGIARAGETTALGDTPEDEAERLRDAEEDFQQIRSEADEELRNRGIAADRPRRTDRYS